MAIAEAQGVEGVKELVGKQVATAYGVVNAERQLAVRWTFYIGPDGKILAIDKKVSPATSGQDIVAKLTALGVRRR